MQTLITLAMHADSGDIGASRSERDCGLQNNGPAEKWEKNFVVRHVGKALLAVDCAAILTREWNGFLCNY